MSEQQSKDQFAPANPQCSLCGETITPRQAIDGHVCQRISNQGVCSDCGGPYGAGSNHELLTCYEIQIERLRAERDALTDHARAELERLRAALEDICDDSRFFTGTPNPVTVLRRIAREALRGADNVSRSSETAEAKSITRDKVPVAYSTSFCTKHRNYPWTMILTAAYSPAINIVCPICDPPKGAPSEPRPTSVTGMHSGQEGI